jgi:hypothetical protein
MACGVVKWFNPPRANTTGCRHWQLSGFDPSGHSEAFTRLAYRP